MKYCAECGKPLVTPGDACEDCGYVFPATKARSRRGLQLTKPMLLAVLVIVAVAALGIVGKLVLDANAEQAAAQEDGAALAEGLSGLNEYGTVATSMLKDLSASSLPYGKPYVSVGWAADFPDRMLVTVVWTGAASRAMQIVFTPGATDALAYVPQDVDPSTLDASVKRWNASVDDDGHVLLNGFEQQSEPQEATSSGSTSSTGLSVGKNASDEEGEPEIGAGDAGNDWSDAYKGDSMYLVIAASETSKDAAEQRLARVNESAGDAGAYYFVDRSDHFEGLSEGLWIVYAPFSSRAEADSECEWMAPRGIDVYVKDVVKKCDDKVLMNPLLP